MSNILSPVTALTAQRYLVGPGVAYLNFVSWASKGTLLGAVPEEGCKVDPGITYRDTPLGGAHGKVKGNKRIQKIEPVATISLMEITYENLLRGLPGFSTADHAWTPVNGEYLGTGLELASGIAPGGATDIDLDSLEIWYTDVGLGVPTKAVLNTDYTVNETTQVVTRLGTVIADTDLVSASYRYDDPTGDDFTIISPGDISDSDYYTNIAIIGTITDGDVSEGGIIILKNVLCSNAPGIELPGEVEAETVLQQEWHAHFLPGEEHSIANAPIEIWWPGDAS